jgi:hypothetical protein
MESGPFKVSPTLKLLQNFLLRNLDTDEPNFDFVDRNLAKISQSLKEKDADFDKKKKRQLYQILYTLKVLYNRDQFKDIRENLKAEVIE